MTHVRANQSIMKGGMNAIYVIEKKEMTSCSLSLSPFANHRRKKKSKVAARGSAVVVRLFLNPPRVNFLVLRMTERTCMQGTKMQLCWAATALHCTALRPPPPASHSVMRTRQFSLLAKMPSATSSRVGRVGVEIQLQVPREMMIKVSRESLRRDYQR